MILMKIAALSVTGLTKFPPFYWKGKRRNLISLNPSSMINLVYTKVFQKRNFLLRWMYLLLIESELKKEKFCCRPLDSIKRNKCVSSIAEHRLNTIFPFQTDIHPPCIYVIHAYRIVINHANLH